MSTHLFKKGMPKPPNSGRKKGTPNKKRLAKAAEVFAEAGFHPLERAMQLIASGALEPKDEVKACLDMYSWCEAKPKTPEEPKNGDLDPKDFEHVTDDELLRLVRPSEGS
jgi:hypothetical protein